MTADPEPDEARPEAGKPRTDPTDTDHPAGDEQAAENAENDPPA